MMSILEVDLAEDFTAIHFMQDITYGGNRVLLSDHCFVGDVFVLICIISTQRRMFPLGFGTSTTGLSPPL